MKNVPKDPLVLYAAIRTDMESMKTGKMCAQAMHAANLFTDVAIIQPLLAGKDPMQEAMDWRAEGKGFGTTLTIAINSLPMLKDVIFAADAMGIVAGIVVDPSYPFLVPNEMVGRLDARKFTLDPHPVGGGKSVCFVEEETVGFMFGRKSSMAVLLSQFSLVPNE